MEWRYYCKKINKHIRKGDKMEKFIDAFLKGKIDSGKKISQMLIQFKQMIMQLK